MKLRNALSLGMGGAALALLLVEPSLAQSPTAEAVPAPGAAPVPNKGDTAWMLISRALVLMMTCRASPCSTAASCARRTCSRF